MASRELKLPMSYVHICETSTALVPNTIATAASIGSDVNGRAVQVSPLVSLLGHFYHISNFLSWRQTQVADSEKSLVSVNTGLG